MPKKAVFYLCDPQNPTYTSRRATKIGMRMHWDAFSVQLENHENREMSRYPKYEKTGFFAYKQTCFDPLAT